MAKAGSRQPEADSEIVGAIVSPFEVWDKKNAGLKVVTLIATLNPVSQVLW
ncbi:MAG TPA: hypothetical protein VGM18_17705 [Candidatus Sulfotelmatobacter sp.]